MTPSLLDRIVYGNPGQVRAGWRIMLFVLAGLAASNVGVPLVSMGLPASTMPWVRSSLECVAVLVATRYAIGAFHASSWRVVGLGRDAWNPVVLSVAALAGAAAIAIPTSALIIAGDLTFVAAPGGNVVRAALQGLAVLVPAALTEELLLRGYPFTVLRSSWGWPVATAITSIVFGLLHLGNPGVTPLAIANVIAAGVFLAGVRVVTGSLAAAWCAHLSWNVTMLLGFHTAVSGLPFATPAYRLVDSGADWLTGGAWGPEGGVGAAVGMIGAFAGLSWAMHRLSPGTNPGRAAGAATNISDDRDDRQEQHI